MIRWLRSMLAVRQAESAMADALRDDADAVQLRGFKAADVSNRRASFRVVSSLASPSRTDYSNER